MELLDEIKNRGYRLTQPRRELVKILTGYPLTVQEMQSALQKKNIKVDLASLYRSIALFIEMGIVRVVELGENKRRYEIVDKNNHHHHLICNKCGSIKDIKMDEQSLLREVKKQSQFLVDHHHLEFFGLCSKCQ